MINSKYLILFLTYLFFVVIGILAYSIYFEIQKSILITRITAMLLLGFVYILNSLKKDMLYIYSLFFSLLSILMLFIETDDGILLATIFFIIYIILTIKLVIKKTKRFKFLPVMLGFLPFISSLSYLIFLTNTSLGTNYIPAIINALLISFMAGISVSNYVLEEDIKNGWLLICTLLFAFMISIFMIEKYYVEIPLFGPIRTISFFGAHYLFMRYMILSENQTIMDLPCEITDESVSK